MKVEFPIFILSKDCSEVLRFESTSEAQRELEKIDVENGEYDAWDRTGLELQLTVQEPMWLSLQVRAPEARSEKLASALKRYGSAVGVEVRITEMTPTEFDRAFYEIAERAKALKCSSRFLRFVGWRRRGAK